MGLTREEVWRELISLVRGARGDRARVPSQKTVGRWLERWVEDGLMERDKRGSHKTGPALLIYRTSRALSLIGCPLSENPPEFFQGNGSNKDTPAEEDKNVPIRGGLTEDSRDSDLDAAPAPDLNVEQPGPNRDTAKFVPIKNPVTEGDLEQTQIKDTPTGTTRAHAHEEPEDVSPCWEAEPYPTDWGAG